MTCLCFSSLNADKLDDIQFYAMERILQFGEIGSELNNKPFTLYYEGRIDAYMDMIDYIDNFKSENKAFTQ